MQMCGLETNAAMGRAALNSPTNPEIANNPVWLFRVLIPVRMSQ